MKKKIILCLTAVLLILGTFIIEQMKPAEMQEKGLLLNEVVTANGSIPDGDGDYSDWIEFYYNGSGTVDLSEYYLSDDQEKLYLWRFPKVELTSGDYLVIYASGKDKVMENGEIHTNFKLDCMGEKIFLSKADENTVTDINVPEISLNHSYGLFEEKYVIFEEGSPGEENTQKQALLIKAAGRVNYSLPAGVYRDAIDLKLNTTEFGAEIYYTLDGSVPTENSILYHGEKIHIENRTEQENRYTSVWTTPFDWDGGDDFSYNPNPQYKATVVKVRLYFPKENAWSEDIWTNTYLVGAEYQLPVVSLSVEEAELFDEDTGLCVPGNAYEHYLATAKKIDSEPRLRTGNYSFNQKVSGHLEYFEETGNKVMEQKVTLRICGHLSRGNGMKSFIVSAWGDDRTGVFDYPFFGGKCTDMNGNRRSTFSSVRLRNFGNDWRRSKFRDALSQSLVAEMDLGTQSYQPAILLINGEYYGLVEIRENRDEEFFERHFGIPEDNLQEIEIKTLRDDTQTEAETAFMELIDYMETHDLSEEKHYQYVESKLDVEQLLDYILIQLYLNNLDWYANNCNFYRSTEIVDGTEYQDGRWRVILYDLDYAINYAEDNNYQSFMESEYECAKMLKALLANDFWRDYYIQRFEELLETNFESSRAIALQRQFEQQIETYVAEDLARWDVYQGENPVKSVSLSYWYEKMEDLRTFFKERPAYAREYFYDSLE